MPKRASLEKAKKRQQKHAGARKFRRKPLPKILVPNPEITVIKKYGRFDKVAKANGWLRHPPQTSHDRPFEVYDATSGGVMRELSPMILGPVVDELDEVLGCNIEDCWQGSKVWTFHMNGGVFDPKKANLWRDGSRRLDPIGDEWIPEWKKWSHHVRWSGEAKRHRAKVDKTAENPNAALFSFYRGKRMPYAEARRPMYCRWYDALVRETDAFKYLRERFEAGVNLVLLDTDGQPRDEVPFVPVTEGSAEKRIGDENAVFGHGYVLACSIQDIDVWSQ